MGRGRAAQRELPDGVRAASGGREAQEQSEKRGARPAAIASPRRGGGSRGRFVGPDFFARQNARNPSLSSMYVPHGSVMNAIPSPDGSFEYGRSNFTP